VGKRSFSSAGAQMARVRASGPNSRLLPPELFHVPWPRLQSIRALTLPSFPNRIVYFGRSA
jgi:hypothetical protein